MRIGRGGLRGGGGGVFGWETEVEVCRESFTGVWGAPPLPCCRVVSASDLPMAMRYRNMQKSYKQHVGVYASGIHGLGLYCTKEIDPGEMVIEYAGTVIRSVLTDKREKLYDSKVGGASAKEWVGLGGWRKLRCVGYYCFLLLVSSGHRVLHVPY